MVKPKVETLKEKLKKKKPLKQKQSQSQSITVNVSSQKRQKTTTGSGVAQRGSKMLTANQSLLVPTVLGLQSANNAQLLNSLQTSLTQLYNKHQTASTAPLVSSSQGFRPPSLLLPPSESPIEAPIVRPLITRPREPRRVEFANTRIEEPPPENPLLITNDTIGLKYTEKGKIDKRSKAYKSLPPEEKQALIETSKKRPSKPKVVESTDLFEITPVVRKGKEVSVVNLRDSEMEFTPAVKQKPKPKETVVSNLINNSKLHGTTTMTPTPAFSSNNLASALKAPEESETDYGNDITSEIDI